MQVVDLQALFFGHFELNTTFPGVILGLWTGDRLIDVGANIGVTVLLFKKYIGASGKIFAFEPDPRVFGYLRSNIEMNKLPNIHLFNCTLGEGRKKAYLQMHAKGDTGNAITLNKEDGLMVDMDCLDDVVNEHQIDVVRLLKVDTAGYEKYVFLGCRTMLSKMDVIIFKAIQNNCQRFHYNLREIVEFLEAMRFHVYCFNTDTGRIEEVNIEHYISNGRSYLYDLFAVKDPSLIKGVQWC